MNTPTLRRTVLTKLAREPLRALTAPRPLIAEAKVSALGAARMLALLTAPFARAVVVRLHAGHFSLFLHLGRLFVDNIRLFCSRIIWPRLRLFIFDNATLGAFTSNVSQSD